MTTPQPNVSRYTGRPLPVSSIAQARAVAEQTAKPDASPANPVAPTDPKRQGSDMSTPMQLLISPAARDRWISTRLSQYTPSYIENVCRGAMSGNLLMQYLMFDLMEQTWPRLSKNLNELKNAVLDLEWTLHPFALKGTKPSPEAQRRARVIEHIIWGMEPDVKVNENDFEDTIYDVLDALGKSIAVLELDFPAEPVQVDLGEGVETVWPLRATRWVHPRYYGYPAGADQEDRLQLNAREVSAANQDFQDGGEWMDFPPDKFIVSIIKQKSGHPINSGLLRMLGLLWAASNFAWPWFINFAQIFGQPIRWANYDPNVPGLLEKVLDMLDNMGSSARAAFPTGTTLQILEAVKGGGAENPQKALLDAADIVCDILILGQTLTTSQGSRGSQALGNVHKDVRDEKVMACAKRAAKILNAQLIKPLCRLNFGDDKLCPYFQPSSVESKDEGAVATKYKTLLSIPGVEISKQQFYDENNLVVPEAGDDVLVGQAVGGFGDPAGGGAGGDSQDNPSAQGRRARCDHRHTAQASDATSKVIDAALEDLTGVEAKWLGGARSFFEDLIAKAKDGSVSDAEFVATIEKARRAIPHLFDKLKPDALQTALENAMSAGLVNGVARGFMTRKVVAK